MFGYNWDVTEQLSSGVRVASTASEWDRMKESSDDTDLKNYDPHSHFLLNHALAEYGIHPGGFSGCGTWWHEDAPEVWHANLRLAGLGTHYYESRQLIKILRIEILTRFLQSLFSA